MLKINPIIDLSVKYSEIFRAIGYRQGHLENDSEHSYQLALVCWSSNHQYNLNLSDEKIIKYALVHDLVEVYAGDTDAFGDKKNIINKKQNEKKAFGFLKNKYQTYKEILEAIEEYEKKNSLESQLVYLLDKIIADLNTVKSKSDYYKVRKITKSMWKEWFVNKVKYSKLPKILKPIADEAINEFCVKNVHIFYVKSSNR